MQLDTFYDQIVHVPYIMHKYFPGFIWYLKKNCLKINNILNALLYFCLKYKHNACVAYI